jgi:hypothetical protein
MSLKPPAAAANAPGGPIIDPTWQEISVLGIAVPGVDLVVCAVSECTSAQLAIAALGAVPGGKGPAALVRFGKVDNQVAHAFRYVDAAGFSREAVSHAITSDLAKVASSLPQGLHNGSVVVNGTKLDYAAYKLADGTVNVGRITPPRLP